MTYIAINSKIYIIDFSFMRNTYFLFVIISFFLGASGFSQDLHLAERSERIIIEKDSSFKTEVSIIFKKNENIRIYPVFYDTELEKVYDFELFEIKGKRLKKIKIKEIIEEDVKLDYITSKKVKSILIPADKDISLNYTISCKELMYFTSLPFFSYDKIDTLLYHIEVPNDYILSHNNIDEDSLSFYKIDSTKYDDKSIWKIKVSPKKVIPDPLQFFGIYKNIKVPLMRTLVYPNSYKNQPKKYLNDWYLKNLSPQTGLNISALNKIDALTIGVQDETKIVNILYNYVRSNFKYVAIEIGMGAFIPSHVNEVFVNKQGDCKDLSNFLSEALKYKGIKSNLALAATFDHVSDCDFPSLGSANHVICVAKIDGKEVLLDPTDSVHVEGTPVQSIQGRTILIIEPSGGEFYDVSPFAPESNEILYRFDLNLNSDKDIIEGSFKINYDGIAGNYLKRIINTKKKTDYTEILKTYYEGIFRDQDISNLSTVNDYNKLSFNGDISILGKTFSDDNNKYLFFDFLPRLFETENRETLMSGTFLGNNFSKRILLKITLDEQIEGFKPVSHEFEEEGVSLKFEINSISSKEIELKYNFVFDYVFIDNKNVDFTNKIITEFNSIINEPFVFKKSKN
ncbi:transglutaminase-like domain-containing protein [Winogradskyella marincola]|uniref:Transglutaminase-like domain-containing protein n=1 Tax=Winogradskyella marincola TaxID=3037795 RepID=A0ABT6G196_9FLAO|nr:transglutaminase-like domain-containing protein [Winogradskyella sp. YYF002]MDG4715619.1 transglutaminase-like domain-containing protein [Winogradskyella sp. YYF002]